MVGKWREISRKGSRQPLAGVFFTTAATELEMIDFLVSFIMPPSFSPSLPSLSPSLKTYLGKTFLVA